MALPLATGTITVTRDLTAQDADPYDSTPDVQTIAVAARAVISPPTGSAKLVGGTRVVYRAALRCDNADGTGTAFCLLPQDQVTDSATGLVWTVLSVSAVNALGQQFQSASVELVTGAT